MKKREILYLNFNHQSVVEKLMKDLKSTMYFATENEITGKYQDFLEIIDSVYLYSNNFHETTLKIDRDNGVMAEFIFLIPNMLFYTSIGFLKALKNSENSSYMQDYLEDIANYCENATTELADVLIDVKDEKKILKGILNEEKIQN